MGIPIPGITREQLEGTSAEAGLRVFPFVTGKWINHTAEVVSIEVLQGQHTDLLIIKGRNGEYGVRISVQLDPEFVSNDFGQDVSKLVERNKDRLLKVLKAFDLAVYKGKNVEVEPSRFPKAVGKVFSFSIQGAEEGHRPKLNDKGWQMTNISFKGLTSELLPVTVPENAATKPVRTCATNVVDGNASEFDDSDDIPF